MSDYGEFLKLIKKAAVEAVEAGKPVAMAYGTVVSVSPLKVLIDQKITLTKAQLVVPEHLTDHELEVTLVEEGDEWKTETASNHFHYLKGRKKVILHMGLKDGDEVFLMREQGGQKYILIDKVVK